METLTKSSLVSQKDKALLERVKQLVHKCIPDATILLYGSVARGTKGPDSDYDILILSDRSPSVDTGERLNGAIYEIELEQDVIIATALRTRTQWETPIMQASPFHKEVQRDAIRL